jgi:tetratricopeptide (TPR) repeat protein
MDAGDTGGEVFRRANALVEECLRDANLRTAEFLAGQVAGHFPAQLDPRHRYVEILLARGKRARAEADLRSLAKERPSDCRAHRMLGDLLAGEGRFAEAMEAHAAHLAEHPGEAGPLHARASLALWDLRDPDLARECAARMREAAARPGTPARTAAWLERNAGDIAARADRAARDGALLDAHARRLDRILWGTLLAAGLLFGAALRATRR